MLYAPAVMAVAPYQPAKNERVVACGQYGEDGPSWSLLTNAKQDKQSTSRPCRHAITKRGFYVVPRIVRAHNQSGYDYTDVCADCILEAVK